MKMTLLSTLLPFLLAFGASSKPVVTIRDSPFSSLQSPKSDITAASIRDLVKRDRDRIHDLTAGYNRDSKLLNRRTNFAPRSAKYVGGTDSFLTVSIGNPPQDYDLLIATATSFTWIGAKKKYLVTNSSTSLGEKFEMDLSSDVTVLGDLYNDTVSFSEGLTIQLPIGVAKQTGKFSSYYNADGVLGLGPTILNTEAFNSSSITPPTVLDALYAQGRIKASTFGLSWAPFDTDTNFAEITWGKCDETKYNGSLTTVNLTSTYSASDFWGIDLQLTYGSPGNETRITPSYMPASGFIDSTATLVSLEQSIFQKYMDAVGAIWDEVYQLPKIPKNKTSCLKSLLFEIGNTVFDLTSYAQLMPRKYNDQMNNGTDEYQFLTVTSLQSGTDTNGFQFILGYMWLERFYTCYDSLNKQFSIAITPDTLSTGN